ncbi:MAG: minor capsid protein, partial [Cyanobacteria bacterium J06626_23]
MLDARILSLIDRYDALAGELEQSVLQRVNAALDAAYRDLERQLRQTYPKLQSEGSLIAAQRKLLVMDELGSLLDLLQGPQADAYEQLLQDLINDADALGGDAAAAYLGAIDPTSPIANHAGIPLEAVALQARDGRQRLYRYSDEFRGNASAIVEQGLIQGWGTGRVQRLMRQQLGVTKSKAETLARTEMSRSLNNGALMRYQQSEVEYAQWVITPSEQLCRICAARNGYIYEVGKVEIPAHPRCLPPGVIVSSTSVKAGTSRQYRGEIITIKTASGKELTATPNHPVLTDQGWIGLGSLNEGSHVFSCVDSERVTHSIDPNKYTRPTLIEKVVASLRESSSVASRRVKVTPKDFHGDGGDSDVCVVSADRLLWNTSDAYFSQPFKHLHLKRRLVDTGRLLAQRLGALLFPANLSAPTGFVSLRCLGFLLGWRHLTNSQPVSLGGIAGVDTSFQKNSSDENATQFPRQRISNRFFRLSIGVASNYLRRVLTPLCGFGRQHSFLRNLPRLSFAASQSAFFKSLPKLSVIDTPELSSVLNRFSSEISLDRVIKLSVSHYSGPVYNLETSTGWYFANNILTHNCRCFWLPVSKDWIDKGLIDAEFIADYRQQGLDLLKQNGQTP